MDPLPTLRRDVSPKAAGRTAAQSTVIIRSKENKKNWMEFGSFGAEKKSREKNQGQASKKPRNESK